MPSEKGIAIILAIQKLHQSLEDRIDEQLPAILKAMADRSTQIISDAELPTDPRKRAKAIKALNAIKRDLTEAIATIPIYRDSVKELITGMEKLSTLTDSYFSDLIDGPFDKKALYEEILLSNIESVKDKMIGAGVRENFGESIKSALRSNIAGNSSRTQINKAIRESIEGTEAEKGFLRRYIKSTANDSIQIFNAEYMEVISTDLNFDKFFYQGTLIADSRPFCKARAGRYYTKAEVEGWAALGNWDGRMPSTTKTTIFIFRGGFFCRHMILPVTDAEYQKQQEKGKTGMK